MPKALFVMIHSTHRQYEPAKAKLLAAFPKPSKPQPWATGAWLGFNIHINHMPRKWWHGWRKPKVTAYMVQRDLSFRAPVHIWKDGA